MTQTINKIGACCALLLFSLSAVASELDLGSIGLELWESLEEERAESRDNARYLLGLSPLQKIRGEWRHRKSERLRADLYRVTWQVQDGYTAEDALAFFEEQLASDSFNAEELFRCQRLNCGSSAEWANKVFGLRLLYGPDRHQRYVVYSVKPENVEYRVVMYAIQRANQRYYLHMDLLRLPGESASAPAS